MAELAELETAETSQTAGTAETAETSQTAETAETAESAETKAILTISPPTHRLQSLCRRQSHCLSGCVSGPRRGATVGTSRRCFRLVSKRKFLSHPQYAICGGSFFSPQSCRGEEDEFL